MSTTTETKTIKPQEEFERLLPDAIANACFSVQLTNDDLEKYLVKCNKISDAARKYGNHYTTDSGQLQERFKNGHLAQIAIEKYLNVSFTDWDSIVPNSSADLLPIGLNVGIKSFKAPSNAPMVSRQIKYPEIMVAIEKDKNIFHCFGVFKPRDLKEKDFICDSLIKDDRDPEIFERKTGFYRIDKGTPFNTLNQLKNIIGPLWTI